MSRFFRVNSSESESDESDDEVISRPRTTAPTRVYQFSDDEDDTKRIVRSAKDKRFDILQTTIKSMRNSMKINDIAKIQTEYENLTKEYDKSKNVVEKEGIPNFYIKCLSDLEDYLQQQWEDTEGRKKLHKLNAKALASLRQKLKKYNRTFEAKIEEYRANPEKFEEVEEEEEVNKSTSDDEKDKKKPSLPKPIGQDDDDDSDDFFATDSDEDSSSEDELTEGGRRQYEAWMFLKSTTSKEDKIGTKRVKKDRSDKADKKAKDEGWTQVSKQTDKMKVLFAKDTEINHQAVLKKFHEILAVRGKKGTDRSEQVDYFIELKSIADKHNLGPAMALKLLFNITSAIIDSSAGTDVALKPDMWERLHKVSKEIYDTVIGNPDVLFRQGVDENVEDTSKPYMLQEDPVTLLERVDLEFNKILQSTDGHSPEYIEKLKDENKVVALIDRYLSFMEKHNASAEDLCRIYLLRIEHTYYKLDVKKLREIREQIKSAEEKRAHTEAGVEEESSTEVKEVVEKKDEKKMENNTTVEVEAKQSKVHVSEKLNKDDATMINTFCKYIYSNGTDRIRTRAMLCHIFHHAKHDRWYEARDLMLISHLQENIQFSDVLTQILYNRTMVQLGLCAFRHGMIRDAHTSLQDIQATGRAKELLAQGLMNMKNMERSPEQEKIDKRRMLPFHMHINLELLECVYLTSAMLLEVPYMAAHEYDYNRRIISKSFRYQLRLNAKQALVGPPESMRDHVVAASKAMMTGDWKKCKDNILAVSCWELFPNSVGVKAMLTRKIQEESLRTYLFTYNKIYDSISMHSLAEMFDLPGQVVHSTISKMIINEELQASWDEPTQTLVLHHGAEPTYLQSLTLQLSDKLNTLVEHHERILDFKYGPIFQREKGQGGYQREKGQGGYQREKGQGGYQREKGQGGYQREKGQQSGGYQRGRYNGRRQGKNEL